MKQTITLLALSSFAFFAKAQITITAADMPVPTAAFNLATIPGSALTAPSKGANVMWDYSTATPAAQATNNYIPETDPFYTAAGIDVYLDEFKNFNSGFGYDVSTELDFNATGVEDKGLYVYQQNYDLASFTGSNLDSLKMPEQKYILATSRKVVKFPFTYGDNWSSSSRRAVDFTLSVAAYGLVNTPAQHVYTVTRTDTVVGHGKLRVYGAGGPSPYHYVLMNKTIQKVKDSFYLGGAPAPTALLTAFGVSQGQELENQFNYNFYRRGAYNYFLRLKHSDANYSTISGGVIHTDVMTPTSVTENALNETFTTVLFPNPCTGSAINLLIDEAAFQGKDYRVVDFCGRVVAQNKIDLKGSVCTIPLPTSIANGMYSIYVNGKDASAAITETFEVNR